MSTEQERSFIARIRVNGGRLGFISGWLLGNEPNLLTMAGDNDELIVYFRCYEDYHNLQVRSNTCFGHFISKNSYSHLGAYPPKGGETTSFNLLDADLKLITLDDIKKDDAIVYLKARNAGPITLIDNPAYETFSDSPGSLVQFELKILERNVPYPTSLVPYDL